MVGRPLVLLSVLALTALPSVSPAAPAERAALDLRDLDETWLHDAFPIYAAYPGFIDVAYASQPDLHIAILFQKEVPTGLPSFHPTLDTRGYVLQAEPLTHEPIVPVMHLLAQGIPVGIRPGQWMTAPHACTMSFVVTGGGSTYILSAGHCLDFPGQSVSLQGHGTIGTVSATTGDGGVGNDYGIVKISAAKLAEVNPRTAGWGGPTGVATTAGLTTGIKHYGFGSLNWYTHETRCRQGVGPVLWGVTTFGFAGSAAWGDSGSEVMTAGGLGVGILTHLSLFPWEGTTLGTRLTYALSELGSDLGATLTLSSGGAVLGQCANT